MSTFMAKASEVERKWYIIDAAGKPLGKVAAQAAVLLRGKHKVTFTPHVDCGDHVIIINCKDAVLTGKKLEQKKWYRHTGYVGHMKETVYSTLMATRPEKAMELAVKGMIPSNTIGRAAMLRLRLFAGSEHIHEAQKPEMFEM
ncbi:MAG: 50S ribosomal protein L13 [Ruminococcus sp.]|nr:50S ribosomal protein L13 [Ruminococcus sp.]